MIKPIVLQILAKNYGGKTAGAEIEFHSISTDTRTIKPGDLFVALKGEHFDAHDYLEQALSKGAAGFVIHDPQSLPATIDVPYWLVEDTALALGYMGAYQRSCFSGPVIAITGSSGKTSVKGMLASILTAAVGADAVFASQGNFNNHIGVPLSLLAIKPEHQYAVIEMGASGVGEIQYLTQMARPDVAMVNNVMAAHVEGFGSVDAIANAKGEIYEGLTKQGVAIINADDKYTQQWQDQNRQRNTLLYSVKDTINPDTGRPYDIYTKNIERLANGCFCFSLVCGEQTVKVNLGILGQHNIANGAAAAACAHALGIGIAAIGEGLENFRNEPGRLQVMSGIEDCRLIDDTYNANPGSVKAAIDVLAAIPGKTILALGDMAELGTESDAEHRAIGEYAQHKEIDELFVQGEKTKLTAQCFGERAQHFTDVETLSAFLKKSLKQWGPKDCVVLVKGSRSARMERVIQALLPDGDNNNVGLAR